MALGIETAAGPPAAREEFDACVRCGLCLNACPTYRVLGEELDSPRGRIYQVAALAAGEIALGAEFELHMDRCLGCRACETACPSGVRYGRIFEQARARLAAERPVRGARGWLRRTLLREVVGHPGRLRALGAGLRWYQNSGAQTLARRSGALRALGLAAAERLCPRLNEPAFDTRPGAALPARGIRRARVAFFPGCVQNVLLPEVNRATVAVLRRHGCEVTVVAGAGCCGALHLHAGERGLARGLARRNARAFAAGGWDAVVVNAAGCGAAMKAYGELDDSAAPLADAVRDATEFLDRLGPRREALGAVGPLTAAYQDACHLAHAQGVREAPRRLLAAVPGLELLPLERPDQCCGSAGVYNLTQPEIAATLARDRADAVEASGAACVVTANPGCLLQLASVLGRARVLHVMEILEASGRAASPDYKA